jgi:hypothetical protein
MHGAYLRSTHTADKEGHFTMIVVSLAVRYLIFQDTQAVPGLCEPCKDMARSVLETSDEVEATLTLGKGLMRMAALRYRYTSSTGFSIDPNYAIYHFRTVRPVRAKWEYEIEFCRTIYTS